jgi:hypothetical protein
MAQLESIRQMDAKKNIEVSFLKKMCLLHKYNETGLLNVHYVFQDDIKYRRCSHGLNPNKTGLRP